MITFEIVVTLVGALVTAFIAISQIQSNALRRQKLEHGIEMLELAQKLNCDEINFKRLIKERFEPLSLESKHPFASGAKFLTQEAFDIVVFIGFGWWTLYLFGQNFIGWALIAGIFALVGLMMTFVTWSARKQRNEAMSRLMRGVESYVAIPPAPQNPPEVQAERVTVPEAKPEFKPKVDVTPVVPVAKDYTETKIAQPVRKDKKERVPEDSILRRHFLTTLRYELASCMPPRPTDSILKRHYDHLLDTKLQMHLMQMDT